MDERNSTKKQTFPFYLSSRCLFYTHTHSLSFSMSLSDDFRAIKTQKTRKRISWKILENEKQITKNHVKKAKKISSKNEIITQKKNVKVLNYQEHEQVFSYSMSFMCLSDKNKKHSQKKAFLILFSFWNNLSLFPPPLFCLC